MWIVLPTKGCICATCESLREVVDEDGKPVPGADLSDVVGWREVPAIEGPGPSSGDGSCG